MRAPTEAPGADAASERSGESLRVRLFGGVDLRWGDRDAIPVESGRMRSLLGFLVLHAGAVHARQNLAFLLWPDSTESQARTNLRKLLHALRRELPDLERHVAVTPSSVSWRRDRSWVDVAEFESALTDAASADPGSDEELLGLRAAVELYRGDLLEGCYDEWALEERERFRDRYVAALRRLIEALIERGQHNETVRLGRELVRADPLREDSHRLLMLAHEAGGDRAGALRAYHEWASTLQRELGVEPSADMMTRYTALARSNETAPLRAAPRVSSLVGRDREWDDLARAWLGAQAGSPRLVLVTGEAGIGKTRLVEELAGWCSHRGALVAQARSYATEGELAYGVASSWLRADPVAPVVARACPADMADLARLVPELTEDRAPPADAPDPAEARRRIFDSVARLLRNAGRPALLVADDAQWCDSPTLQLVHYLVRLDPALPLLVVATARREDLDPDHPLTAVGAALELADRASEVNLGRLGRADTELLARDLAGADLGPAVVDALHATSEGNPLFIVELLRSGWTGTESSEAALPRKLHALIDSRLRRLGASTRRLAAVAATVGRAFSTELLRAASGADDDSLAGALDELWRRGIIREQGGDAYDFTHAKLREVAYAAASRATRQRDHAAVAAALQRLHGGDLDTVSAQVALHYDRAGRPGDAVGWYVRAAHHAQRVYADAEALRLLDRAEALVAELPPSERPHRELEVLAALPAVLAGVDGFASARLADVQQRALKVAAQLGVDPDPVLLRSLVMSRLCARDFDTARTAAVRLRRAAEETGDEALAVESDYLLGITAFWGGEVRVARQCFERVVERADPARGGEHLVRFGHDPAVVCLSRLANTLFFLGDDEAARRTRDDAVARADEVGHPYSRAAAYGFGTLVSIDLGDVEVVRDFLRARPWREQVWGPTALFVEVGTGYLDVLDGDADTGIRRIADTIAAAGDIDTAPGLHASLRRVLVAAHEAAGDPHAGLAATDEALGAPGSRLWEAEVRRVRAEFLALTGRPPAEVAAELETAAKVAARQGAAGLARRVEASRSRLGLA